MAAIGIITRTRDWFKIRSGRGRDNKSGRQIKNASAKNKAIVVPNVLRALFLLCLYVRESIKGAYVNKIQDINKAICTARV